MAAPASGGSTSSTMIQVTWTALTTLSETGGATIRSYNLQWDQDGTGTTYVDLVGFTTTYTLTTYTVTGLTAG